MLRGSVAMTANDMALLRLRLDQLTLPELLSLDDANLPWLPPLRTSARDRALLEITNALQAQKPLGQRLKYMAWLHCWLLQRRNALPWTMFRCKKSSLLADFRKVQTGLASLLRCRGYDVALAWTVDSGTVYTCLLIQDVIECGSGFTAQHRVSYVALWPGLPLLAVHTQEKRTKRTVLRALHAVLRGELACLLAKHPGGLGATLRASFRHLSLQVGDGAIGIPELANLPDEPSSQEEEKLLEEWQEFLAQMEPRLRPVDDRYTLTDGKGTWVHFEGPGLLEKLRKHYMRGFRAILSEDMMPAFLGERYHVVKRSDK